MQLRTSKVIRTFHEIFKNKFGFSEYVDKDSPTIFFGVYDNNDRKAITEHSGLKIIWFAGTDATMITDTSFLDGATVVAESEWIRKDLNKLGIKYESISLCLDNIYNWKSVSLGKSLYWYGGNNSKYGKQYLPVVRKEFPDINIITNDAHTISREEMPKIYADCFAVVRPIEHDGFSMTVAEAGLMGRMSIWNMKTPFSVPYEGAEGLIDAIKTLRDGYNPERVSKRCRGWFIEQEALWADLILRLCGTSEIDITGIFHEDIGRCGSIFRLVRRKDIEKIGGFGESQFERSWFSEQMIKLNKKQLITSKNSGFIATEFKSIENKGYPKGFKDFRTYDKKYD